MRWRDRSAWLRSVDCMWVMPSKPSDNTRRPIKASISEMPRCGAGPAWDDARIGWPSEVAPAAGHAREGAGVAVQSLQRACVVPNMRDAWAVQIAFDHHGALHLCSGRVGPVGRGAVDHTVNDRGRIQLH